jgi:hypothetical protein
MFRKIAQAAKTSKCPVRYPLCSSLATEVPLLAGGGPVRLEPFLTQRPTDSKMLVQNTVLAQVELCRGTRDHQGLCCLVHVRNGSVSAVAAAGGLMQGEQRSIDGRDATWTAGLARSPSSSGQDTPAVAQGCSSMTQTGYWMLVGSTDVRMDGDAPLRFCARAKKDRGWLGSPMMLLRVGQGMDRRARGDVPACSRDRREKAALRMDLADCNY